jgi:hypothetical protein
MWLSPLQQSELLSHSLIQGPSTHTSWHFGWKAGQGQFLFNSQVSPSQQYNFGSQGGGQKKLVESQGHFMLPGKTSPGQHCSEDLH